MEIISDITDANGKRHIVARYTDEERAEMAERAAAYKAEMEAALKAKEDK